MARSLFLSYRRGDRPLVAERLHHELAQRFGEERVFYDREDIDHGANWRTTIRQQVEAADAVVALIGPRWLDELKRRANGKADDVLHFELATALALGKQVLPVLVDGAGMPAAVDLPADLAALPDLQAAPLATATFDRDVRALLVPLRIPWVVAIAWAAASALGWFIGLLAAIGVLMLAGELAKSAIIAEGGGQQMRAGQSPTALALYAFAGAVFGLIVGSGQWLVLRPWWPKLGWMPWAHAAMAALACLVMGWGYNAEPQLMSMTFLGLLLVPVGAGVVTWLAMRGRMSRAGWFNLVHSAGPLLAMLAVTPWIDKTSPSAGQGLWAIAAVVAANLVSGILLVALMRRARVRRR